MSSGCKCEACGFWNNCEAVCCQQCSEPFPDELKKSKCLVDMMHDDPGMAGKE